MPNGFGNNRLMDSVWEGAGALAAGAGLAFFQKNAATSKQQTQKYLLGDLAVAVGGIGLATMVPSNGPMNNIISGVGYGGAALAGQHLVQLMRQPATTAAAAVTNYRAPMARIAATAAPAAGRTSGSVISF